jgi:hypothetical protein
MMEYLKRLVLELFLPAHSILITASSPHEQEAPPVGTAPLVSAQQTVGKWWAKKRPIKGDAQHILDKLLENTAFDSLRNSFLSIKAIYWNIFLFTLPNNIRMYKCLYAVFSIWKNKSLPHPNCVLLFSIQATNYTLVAFRTFSPTTV